MAVNYTTTTTEPSEILKPYLKYGFGEAQRIYEKGGTPVVAPSELTKTGIEAAQNRAIDGSPLLGASQQQQLGTIQGDYLSGNPFFQGAFQPAAQAATSAFNQAIGNIASKSSMAGRYGSGAMQNLQNQAAGQLAQSLTGTAGKLAYENYAAERARQEAAATGAPSLAEADYGDIEKLLKLGQIEEGYTQRAVSQPQESLNAFLANIQGLSPAAGSSTSTPYYTNQAATNLGNVATAVDLGTKIFNWLKG